MHCRDLHFLYWPRHLLGIPLQRRHLRHTRRSFYFDSNLYTLRSWSLFKHYSLYLLFCGRLWLAWRCWLRSWHIWPHWENKCKRGHMLAVPIGYLGLFRWFNEL